MKICFSVPNSKKFVIRSLRSLITGYKQRNNSQHLQATSTMTPSWSKLQYGFCHHTQLFNPKKVAGKTPSTHSWYLAKYICCLFTASTLPNNYLLHIPLERKSVLSVTRPFLSAKEQQHQTSLILCLVLNMNKHKMLGVKLHAWLYAKHKKYTISICNL